MDNTISSPSYKIIIKDRNYNEWDIYYCNNNEVIIDDEILKAKCNPIENKLFSNDIIIINNNNKCQLVSRELMNNIYIPCVLVIEGNKTYGKYKNKLLYRCIPDNKQLPIFLVPYELKTISFNKNLINLFVTIKFVYWDNKHPTGSITNNFGNVNTLSNYYEYQIYCKSLNISIQPFTKYVSKKLEKTPDNYFIEKIYELYPNIKNRTNQEEWCIFSIDPIHSQDFDDAFSIKHLKDGKYLLSIYIANVPLWLDILDAWGSFSDRVSTIYLPENLKKTMLPPILSNCLCSLQSNVKRISFTMDIILDESCNIEKIEYNSCIINVLRNFYYEEEELLKSKNYLLLLDISKKMSIIHHNYNNIIDSHTLVEYLMILMNYNSSKELLKYNTGIFRCFSKNNEIDSEKSIITIKEDNICSDFIKIFNIKSSYININNIKDRECLKHPILPLDSYTHITSPIRRLVDLLNMIQLQKELNIITLSKGCCDFYDCWINKMDFVNSSMKTIKKVQNECFLLDLCFNNPDIFDKVYDGCAFDKKKIDQYTEVYKYSVYIPEIKFFSSVITEEHLNDYEIRKYKLFVFNNEDNFKKKIRLHLLNV